MTAARQDSLAFARRGMLLAAPATEGPSQVMMLSNPVRLPLIFVSGVFVSLDEMPARGQWLAPFSPLSYAADLIRISFGKPGYWPVSVDALASAGFAVLFVFSARQLHHRTRNRAR